MPTNEPSCIAEQDLLTDIGITRTSAYWCLCRRRHKHQLRHAHAVELLHEGVPLPLIQRQLGHSHLSTTGTYLQGISSEEIISTVHARRAPMMHASAGLDL
jgi:site-specific recombinase XerD